MNEDEKAPFAALHKAEPDRLRAQSVAIAYKVAGRGSPTKAATAEEHAMVEPDAADVSKDDDAAVDDGLANPSIF